MHNTTINQKNAKKYQKGQSLITSCLKEEVVVRVYTTTQKKPNSREN